MDGCQDVFNFIKFIKPCLLITREEEDTLKEVNLRIDYLPDVISNLLSKVNIEERRVGGELITNIDRPDRDSVNVNYGVRRAGQMRPQISYIPLM